MVSILGRNIPIRTTAAPDTVREVEEFVTARLHTISSALTGGDAQLVLTLALLNITEELFEARALLNAANTLEASRLERIITKLENA